MPSSWSSRERLLAALESRQLAGGAGLPRPDTVYDRTPCSFMLYGGLKSQCANYAEFIERQIALGLDAFVELPPRQPVVANDHYNLHGLPRSEEHTSELQSPY